MNGAVSAIGLGLGVLGLVPAGAHAAAGSHAAAAGAHAAAGATALPITSFDQVVADTAHGHLFISQGSSSQNHILVTNLVGQQVGSIAGQNGVMGIALSPDGSTLYAALSGSHAVTAISTTTLAQTAFYSVGSANTPAFVAVQSGKVWVSYDTGTAGQSAIGDIDLTAVTPAFETQAAMGGWYAAPQVAADPHDTGVLVAAEPGLSPSSAASYDTTAEPVTVRASSANFTSCGNQRDLAVAPGGSQFILACGSPYAHYRYSTADLSQAGSYASTNYPAAVALDAAGDVAAGTADNSQFADVYVYHQNGDQALNTYNLVGTSSGSLAPRGLAFAADGSKLFAVIQNGTAFSLAVIDGPTLIKPVLGLTTGASRFTYEPTVHVTAHLGTTDTNRTVSIYAQPFGSKARTLLKTASVNSSGNLTVSYLAPHSTRFTAVFAGDAQYAPRTVTHVVYVRAKVTETLGGYYASLRSGGRIYRLYHHSAILRSRATVAPNKSGQCVKFEVQAHYQGAWRAVQMTGCGKLDSSSKVVAGFALTHAALGYHYRMRADYIRARTDTSNLSNDSSWQYFIVRS